MGRTKDWIEYQREIFSFHTSGYGSNPDRVELSEAFERLYKGDIVAVTQEYCDDPANWYDFQTDRLADGKPWPIAPGVAGVVTDIFDADILLILVRFETPDPEDDFCLPMFVWEVEIDEWASANARQKLYHKHQEEAGQLRLPLAHYEV